MKRCRFPPAAAPVRLLSSSCLQLVRRIPKQTLIRAGENDPRLRWNELQLGTRRAVSRGWQQQSGARDAFARQRRRPARSLQTPTRHLNISTLKKCVSHERLGHTAHVFRRRRAEQKLAGGTEPQ